MLEFFYAVDVSVTWLRESDEKDQLKEITSAVECIQEATEYSRSFMKRTNSMGQMKEP